MVNTSLEKPVYDTIKSKQATNTTEKSKQNESSEQNPLKDTRERTVTFTNHVIDDNSVPDAFLRSPNSSINYK